MHICHFTAHPCILDKCEWNICEAMNFGRKDSPDSWCPPYEAFARSTDAAKNSNVELFDRPGLKERG